jgi:hypothetical protein
VRRLRTPSAALALLLAAQAPGAAEMHLYTLTLVSGHLYGPAALSDQPTPAGALSRLRLDTGPGAGLKGVIVFLNNGTEEPNIPGEAFQGHAVDGRLSDGTLINESIDVGYLTLLNGQVKLVLAAVGGGPNRGDVHFYLDEDWNWTIFDDIAIDPGFAVGVIKIDAFSWSTGPRALPESTQTQRHYPGGVDRAGTKDSGAYIPGRLGDDDFDGRLDGVFNAVGSFPLTSVILPGAPFAQTRTFVSDIAVAPLEAAALTIANARSHLRLAERGGTPAEELRAEAEARLQMARRHLARVASVDAAAAGWRDADDAVRRVLEGLAAKRCADAPCSDELGPALSRLLTRGQAR